MSSVIGSEGSDLVVLVPDGVDPNDISVSTDAEGASNIKLTNNVSDLEVTATEPTTSITGRKLSNSTITAKGPKGAESVAVVVETKSLIGSSITKEGKGNLTVDVKGTIFKKSTIDAGVKKRNDIISFTAEANVNKSTVNAGKGNDAIRFGKGVTFTGKTTIDLGKGGKDSVTVEADAISDGGKLKVTSFGKKDTITVGDETITYKDVKNGAEIPNLKVKLV
jgi:hypothetical protein